MTTNQTAAFDLVTQKNVNLWLSGQYDEETKSAIRKTLKENPKDITDAFYTNLTFGTGGLRGLMGIGSNRMNKYTVAAATQGLANYLIQQPKPAEGYSVFIGYDSRNQSREFAEESARVLAGNGIKVLIFKEIRPTPLISFGCRTKKCSSAIMITASHNPPKYNGYKVYWNEGAQILPPHDKNIIAEVQKITDPSQVKKKESLNHPLIQWIGDEMDDVYLKAINPLQIYREDNKNKGHELKIVYTSLHGTGITMVPKALNDWGFSSYTLVDKQVLPDGNFPTVHFPNPEEVEALKLGIDKLKEVHGDILIATDPDCDRMGVVVNHRGQVQILTGNQIACICLEHILKGLTAQQNLPAKAAFIKTIVTTELFQAICQTYNKPCFDVLTGFKYIAEKIHEWEKEPDGYKYIFGGEEFFGTLYGTNTRDKDAIIASTLICEAASQAKKKNQTLVDSLNDIYKQYGYYCEKLLSVNFEESKAGRDRMANGIKKIQSEPPKEINGIPVKVVEDYETLIKKDLTTGKTEKITSPKSAMLIFWLEDGSKLVVRPSGTEPKIKIYSGVVKKNFSSLDDTKAASDKYAGDLMNALKIILQ